MKFHPGMVVLAALVLLAFCPTTGRSDSKLLNPGDPKPVASVYVKTFGAGFHYEPAGHRWRMFIDVQILKPAPGNGPLYLRATFENPQRGAPNLVVEGDSRQTSENGVKLETPSVSGMRNLRTYTITVFAYTDKARTRLVDTLTQKMLCHYLVNPEATLHGARPRFGMRVVDPSGGQGLGDETCPLEQIPAS